MDVALRKVKGNIERLFDKNLTDLVRGIRNNVGNESKYITSCIDEIKQELRHDNMAVKVNAVQKLTYLQMLGYDISWASFNVVEVMSCARFSYKRVGYLSASQSFHADTEVLMLTTNMARKDLNSQNQYDAAVALSSLSCFISTDVARDLANDVIVLLSSTKPYLRKRAILLLYKIFLKFPEALRPAFPRLKDKLDDPDPGVQSAAVNVICELARKNPKNYLGLAPVFFKLMTTSTNNWMLIKIIKLFGSLTPLEPRLGKKLIEPLTNLIHSTSAMSLLYECINTVIAVLISISSGMPGHNAAIQLCVQKLRILIEDSDQNLKYLGLLAMGRILHTHPKTVTPHKDLILRCLDDRDDSIRLRALDLLYGMVSKKNLMEIVKKLLGHLARVDGSNYRDELLAKLIFICSQDNYHFVTNFEWYVSVLVEVSRLESVRHGTLVADQMLDVAVRVPSVRHFTVRQMSLLLHHAPSLLSTTRSSMLEVLFAAAWICGEYGCFLDDAGATIAAMMAVRPAVLPARTLAAFVQNSLKLYSQMLTAAYVVADEAVSAATQHSAETEREGLEEEAPACPSVSPPSDAAIASLEETYQLLMRRLPVVAESAEDLEVQERAVSGVQLISTVHKLCERKQFAVVVEFRQLFEGQLNPVAAKAQKKVPVPDGLDLDTPLYHPSSSSCSSSDDDGGGDDGRYNKRHSRRAGSRRTDGVACDVFVRTESHYHGAAVTDRHMHKPEPTAQQLQQARELRLQQQSHNPHYLRAGGATYSADLNNQPPVEQLQLEVPLVIDGLAKSDAYMQVAKTKVKKAKKRRSKRKSDGVVSGGEEGVAESRSSPAATHGHTVDVPQCVVLEGEMPDGARCSSDDNLNQPDARPHDDPHRALDIDLSRPLDDGEMLCMLDHRQSGGRESPRASTVAASGVGDGDAAVKKHKHRKKDRSSKKDKHKPPENDSMQCRDMEHGELVGLAGQDQDQHESRHQHDHGDQSSVICVNGSSNNDVKRSSKHKSKKHSRQKSRKTGYEETAGICTPSQENAPAIVSQHTTVSCDGGNTDTHCYQEPTTITPLFSNNQLSVCYDVCASVSSNETSDSVNEPAEQQQHEVLVTFNLTNLTDLPLTDVKIQLQASEDVQHDEQGTCSDTTRDQDQHSNDTPANNSVSVHQAQCDSVEPRATSHVSVHVRFSDVTPAPRRFPLHISYQTACEPVLVRDAGGVLVSCVSCLTGPVRSADDPVIDLQQLMTQLLSSEQLTARASCIIAAGHTNFDHVLRHLIIRGRLSLVEQVDTTASLYAVSRPPHKHHLCVLAKLMRDGQIGIDAKCSSQQLVDTVLAELRLIVQTTLDKH